MDPRLSYSEQLFSLFVFKKKVNCSKSVHPYSLFFKRTPQIQHCHVTKRKGCPPSCNAQVRAEYAIRWWPYPMRTEPTMTSVQDCLHVAFKARLYSCCFLFCGGCLCMLYHSVHCSWIVADPISVNVSLGGQCFPVCESGCLFVNNTHCCHCCLVAIQLMVWYSCVGIFLPLILTAHNKLQVYAVADTAGPIFEYGLCLRSIPTHWTWGNGSKPC